MPDEADKPDDAEADGTPRLPGGKTETPRLPGGKTETPRLPGGKTESKNDSERPTVSPPFDPVEFAKGTKKTPNPMAIIVPPPSSKGENPHTKATPAQGVPTQNPNRKKTPPGLGGDVPIRRTTPTSTLSLANARVPSNLPPIRIDPPKKEEEAAPKPTETVDDEWGEMELATRPPPADGPGEDPIVEIAHDRTPLIELDDVDLDAHGAETVRRPTPLGGIEGVVPSSVPEKVPERVPEALPPSGRGGVREMHDRVSLGDYSGALEIAEGVLAEDPEHADAKACAENCRVVLRQMYATRIGPLDRVPVVMVPRDQFRWLSIDHKAGFVLSLVDGVSSLEMIIDVSGMPELDTLRILSELAQQRIISLR